MYSPIWVQEDSLDPVRPEQERAPPVLAAVQHGLRRLLVVDGRPVLVHRADCWLLRPLPRTELLAVAVRRHRHRRRHGSRAPDNAVHASPVMAAGNDDDTTVAAAMDGAVRRRLRRSHASIDDQCQ